MTEKVNKKGLIFAIQGLNLIKIKTNTVYLKNIISASANAGKYIFSMKRQ